MRNEHVHGEIEGEYTHGESCCLNGTSIVQLSIYELVTDEEFQILESVLQAVAKRNPDRLVKLSIDMEERSSNETISTRP